MSDQEKPISDELRDLYQEVIVDHSQHPRNHGSLEGASSTAEGHNPLCGDKVKVFLKLKDGKIEEAKFVGGGCAISTASASMMTDTIKGKTIEEAQKLFSEFHQLVTTGPEDAPWYDALGKLKVFAGVCEFPSRVKCASLVWHTLMNAIDGSKPKKSEGESAP